MMGVLDGPSLDKGAEKFDDHVARLGRLLNSGSDLIEVLEASGLRGRGGAGFPVGAKWRTVAGRSSGSAVVLANGAEGEPLSFKDRLLMEYRPHLVLDGALAAARAASAGRIVLYVGSEHTRAHDSLRVALSERGVPGRLEISVVRSPAKYVAGEETAAVHCVDDNLALPRTKPPRPFERGVGGAPTLVQNVESLAYAALIARRGAEWFEGLGANGSSGALLVTVSGAVRNPGVREVPQGTTVSQAIESAGGPSSDISAILLGGYFGGWVTAKAAAHLPLDAVRLRAGGRSLGCGVVHVLPARVCGVAEAAAIMGYLANESARQCGPCHFGLRAMSDAVTRIASNNGEPGDLMRLTTWSREIRGRGACNHPDGAAGFLESALTTFEHEFIRHQEHRQCGLDQ